MPEIVIRNALLRDIPHFLPLMEQLGYPQSLEGLQKRFEVFATQPDYGVLLAEATTQVLGWIAWSKSPLFISDITRIHIEGLVVDRNFRGQGIGKKLMAEVEKFAAQFSPCIIDLTSGLKRAKDGTHEFYKSLGYQNEGAMAKLYLRKVL
ncbi:N-acetyltransferase [Legionella micdadei]|nr:N-acetyltransferase [Legionella micdadei]ARH01640.1 N-acetyltransferase [Legionella micdadei]KTD27260.1 Acetyltransferase (GNAT) family protein [Legionella micdadei]SCY61288.1 Ribosomal protein S18 acetylase RimI [Legionella micdadei]